jgi:hypothetical protein
MHNEFNYLLWIGQQGQSHAILALIKLVLLILLVKAIMQSKQVYNYNSTPTVVKQDKRFVKQIYVSLGAHKRENHKKQS